MVRIVEHGSDWRVALFLFCGSLVVSLSVGLTAILLHDWRAQRRR